MIDSENLHLIYIYLLYSDQIQYDYTLYMTCIILNYSDHIIYRSNNEMMIQVVLDSSESFKTISIDSIQLTAHLSNIH